MQEQQIKISVPVSYTHLDVYKRQEEVYTLLGDTVYEGTGSEIKVGSISDNRYYAAVSFEETGDFNILLGQDGDKSISLTAEGGKV